VRRAKGEGSVTKRKDGRWQARYQVNGKRKYIYGKTKTEVAKKLNTALNEINEGFVSEDKGFTVEKHTKSWLETSKGSLRYRTWERYEQVARKHIFPEIGHIRLRNLTPMLIQDLYQKKLKAISPRTVQYIHVTLHRSLSQALRWNLVPRNVAALVYPPKVTKREIRPLTVEEVNILFKTVKGNPLEALYVLAVTAGLRRGELLGLRWEDIDLEIGTLRVKRSLSFNKEGPYLVPPKTAKGTRSISLSQICVEALRKHKLLQLEQKKVWNRNLDIVFPNKVGEYRRSQRVINDCFETVKRKGNLPDVRFHDLRHTCATLLLTKGVHPKIVQELLGHSSISITLDTYSHVLPNMQEKAVRAMDNIFEGG
jgi:integrase